LCLRVEGAYRDLAKSILKGYEVDGRTLVASGKQVEFTPAEVGYDIRMESLHLGNTLDNYFLVHLTGIFEEDGQDALERFKELSKDKRLIQATELQGSIERKDASYAVGGRTVGYSSTYFECSCPDWKYRRRLGGCKHIAALRLLDV
jgi:hypothetical protein